MMEGGSLFNTGFFGSSFYWWMGQIADDSTWRDNELSSKYPDRDTPLGWGKRYRVRIIGVHDKEEETIPSDQLPWANIMYPVTAGGGQAGSHQSANLRQGMFVFGFYMDGQDMQVPVIMGVLGNNSKTPLNTKIGNDESNFSGTSGVAQGQEDKQGTEKEPIPDNEKVIKKPKSKSDAKEESILDSGVDLNKFGLPFNLPSNPNQLADLNDAKSEIERIKSAPELTKKFFNVENVDEITQSMEDNFIQNKVVTSMRRRVAGANKPGSPSQAGATIESVDCLQMQTAETQKREDKYQEKTVLVVPDDTVGSAVKAMQTISENLAKKTEKYLSSFSDYADAVSGGPNINTLTKLKKDSACAMSKYMKIILDKMMEYTSKTLNEEISEAISDMPSCMRYQMGDMMDIGNEKLLEKYNEITNGMCGLLESILEEQIDVNSLQKQAEENAAKVGITTEQTVVDPETGRLIQRSILIEEDVSHPNVPICSAESIIGQAISNVKVGITSINSQILDGTNVYLKDIKSELERLDGDLVERVQTNTDAGKVLEITDEEVLDEVRGGTLYKTTSRVGTIFKNSTDPSRSPNPPVGFTTAETTGQGLTVDITVSLGGLAGFGNAGGATDFEFLSQGTGYTNQNAVNCNGGSGTGMKVNLVTSAGEITTMFVHTTGTGYKKDEELTVQAGNFDAKFTLTAVEGKIDDGAIKINEGGNGYVVGDVYTVLGGSGDGTFMIISISDIGDKVATNTSSPKKLSNSGFNLSNLVGNVTSALNFENITANVFPFELPPNPAVSDFYTLANGGEGQPDFELPNFAQLPKQINEGSKIAAKEVIPFAEPTLKKTIDLVNRTTNIASSSVPTEAGQTSITNNVATGAVSFDASSSETAADTSSSTPTSGSSGGSSGGGGGGGGY